MDEKTNPVAAPPSDMTLQQIEDTYAEKPAENETPPTEPQVVEQEVRQAPADPTIPEEPKPLEPVATFDKPLYSTPVSLSEIEKKHNRNARVRHTLVLLIVVAVLLAVGAGLLWYIRSKTV